MPVTMHQAKTHFSKLVAQAELGEEIIISRGSKPVAKLVPLEPPKARPREPGLWKGKFELTDAFFEPLPEEELALWEGAGP